MSSPGRDRPRSGGSARQPAGDPPRSDARRGTGLPGVGQGRPATSGRSGSRPGSDGAWGADPRRPAGATPDRPYRGGRASASSEPRVVTSNRPVGASALWEGGTAPRRPLRRPADAGSSGGAAPATNPSVAPTGRRPAAASGRGGRSGAAPGGRARTGQRRPLEGERPPPPGFGERVRRRYGWRLVAAPFLAALTVLTIVLIARSPETTPTAAGPTAAGVGSTSSVEPLPGVPQAPSRTVTTTGQSSPSATTTASATVQDPVDTAPSTGASGTDPAVPTDPAEVLPANLAVGALPAGAPFAVAGDGTYRVVGGAGPQAGTSPTVVRYSVEIENGVAPAEGDEAFAQFVDRTLADPRSWTTVKGVSLQRVDDPAEADFRITLTSQQTVRGMCGFSVPLESSCYTRAEGRVVINDARWVRGSLTYGADMTSYREYAVNHEVGHALGYGHQPCGENGALAPVMMQQSWSASNDALAGINGSTAADGKACVPNPWPDPAGAEKVAAAAPTG